MSPRIPAVGVVGAGAVGQAVGAALVSARLCDQLLLASSSVDQAAALADDLNDMCAGIGSRFVRTRWRWPNSVPARPWWWPSGPASRTPGARTCAWAGCTPTPPPCWPWPRSSAATPGRSWW
ncbi:hypothetical protein ACFQ3Z_45815 [Streptomyces nogalater]